ncbi:MAG: PIG-L family deacetylase [Planctomycetales bacterium]|nr:PIG-L family deacetylase [Planctomycetales bacterium]
MDTFFSDKRVIVLAPHTDDGEFGCGGTIARFVEAGSEVYYMAFSVCEQSVPYGFAKDELENELKEAMKVLGLPAKNTLIYRYPVRRLQESRQEILQLMIDARSEIQPDIVFMPCLKDCHQDHQTVSAEGLRAFKHSTIFSYEMPWNNLTLETSSFVVLEERHLQKKIDALACYKTQAFRPYADEEFLRGLGRVRGVQIGGHYAEAFELVRLVLGKSRVAVAGAQQVSQAA